MDSDELRGMRSAPVCIQRPAPTAREASHPHTAGSYSLRSVWRHLLPGRPAPGSERAASREKLGEAFPQSVSGLLIALTAERRIEQRTIGGVFLDRLHHHVDKMLYVVPYRKLRRPVVQKRPATVHFVAVLGAERARSAISVMVAAS